MFHLVSREIVPRKRSGCCAATCYFLESGYLQIEWRMRVAKRDHGKVAGLADHRNGTIQLDGCHVKSFGFAAVPTPNDSPNRQPRA